MAKPTVGIIGIGTYLPSKKMTAKEISDATNGVWSEDAVKAKLGIVEKYVPGEDDGTQEMGVKAALNCLKNITCFISVIKSKTAITIKIIDRKIMPIIDGE